MRKHSVITALRMWWIIDHASPYRVKQLPTPSREWPKQACLCYRLGYRAALDQVLEIVSPCFPPKETVRAGGLEGMY